MRSAIVGELSLDGSVRHVDGILPMTYVAKEAGYKSIFVPQADAPEAALVEGIDVYPLESLARLVTHFRDYHPIEPYHASIDLESDPPSYAADFQDIKGQVSGQKQQFGLYCHEVVGGREAKLIGRLIVA